MSNRFNRNVQGRGGGQRGYFPHHHTQQQQHDNSRNSNYYTAAAGGNWQQRNPQRGGGGYQNRSNQKNQNQGQYQQQKPRPLHGHIRKEEPHDDIIELPDEVAASVAAPAQSPQAVKPAPQIKNSPDEAIEKDSGVANSSTEPAPSTNPEPSIHSSPSKPVVQIEPVSSTAQESAVPPVAPGGGGGVAGSNQYRSNQGVGQYLYNLAAGNPPPNQEEQWGDQSRQSYNSTKPANAPGRAQQGYGHQGPPKNEGNTPYNSGGHRRNQSNMDFDHGSIKDNMSGRNNQRGQSLRKRKPDSFNDSNPQHGGGGPSASSYDNSHADTVDWNNLEDLPKKQKKCSARCRLYVGNLPNDIDDDKFKALFSSYGMVSESYLHKDKAFGFVRLDTRGNAEAAKQELDGSIQKGRTLRVRFAVNSSSLKIEHLPPYVSNELLEAAFSQFGPVERAVVVVDDRGKALGYGIVDFERKSSALQALRRITEGTFLLTSSPKPITATMLEMKDEDDGMNEKTFNKTHREFVREREYPPRFAHPGSFEFDLACKWKHHYDYEKQRRELLDKELEQGRFNLENSLQDMIQQHQTDMLRQALLRKQKELEHIDEMRRRRDEEAQRRAEEMRQREDALKRQHEEMMRQRDMFPPPPMSSGPVDSKQPYSNIPPPPLPPHMAEIGFAPPRYSEDNSRQSRGDDDSAQKRMRRY